MAKLQGKDLISVHDLAADDIWEIFDRADGLKAKQKLGEPHRVLAGKTLAMIFEKPSTRTRMSFSVGMWQLGGLALDLSPDDIQLGKRESICDVAKTLSRYVDGIMTRTFSHKKVLEMEKCSSVPVINGLSDLLHPCQALSDIFTVVESKGKDNLKNLKIAYIGDGNNVCHSLMFTCAKLGISLIIASPEGYEPKEEVVKAAFGDAKKTGALIEIMNDPVAAASKSDVLYTDVWASMGQEKEAAGRKSAFRNFQINKQMLKLARPDVLVMHCLPAHRGEEITDEVIDGRNSIVFDQAENRLHVQKAILALLLS